MASSTIMIGDCLKVLRGLPDGMAQTCVTSPPYYGLRDYGHVGQIGLEETPDAYVARLVDVFREVRRVLRDDGTLWLNIGDSYARAGGEGGCGPNAQVGNTKSGEQRRNLVPPSGCKAKDLLGIPWMVAFALRADGWFLRSDIIWHKPNPMPESVRDRPTSAHEHVFLLTKRGAYFYDAEAIRQPLADASYVRLAQDVESQAGSARANGGAKTNGPMKAVGGDKQRGHSRRHVGFNDRWDAMSKAEQQAGGANARNVWTIATQPYSGAHFATMPPALAERSIKAGSRPGDMVLDPFGGAGTTGLVADRLGRSATLIELNPEYARLARERITADAPLLMAAQ
jgi:DNA modification methylase